MSHPKMHGNRLRSYLFLCIVFVVSALRPVFASSSRIVSPERLNFDTSDNHFLGVSWSPDGSKLAGAQQDSQTVLIWNLDGQIVGSLHEDITYIWSIAWNANDELAL